MPRLLSLLLLLLPFAAAQIPCDDEYGRSCPSHSPDTVGSCLSALPPSSLSAACLSYMSTMSSCAPDLSSLCAPRDAGAFTGEALSCLTEWTKPDQLSAECKGALPGPKEEGKPREKSEAEERKAKRRRRKREAAAKLAKDQHPQNPDKKKKEGGGERRKIKKEL
ncbi:hypothetical protein TeGR_g10818 [Tetraparma gracilis]|uniref:Uncharacterized protein n=1 Tax=Tetraparma gracilis TaxID=2962635 RepID=A0ABQ6N5G7_9STRA|nr:hypothetical protein TeGR_g10818 [Tetraparma gracilis]